MPYREMRGFRREEPIENENIEYSPPTEKELSKRKRRSVAKGITTVLACFALLIGCISLYNSKSRKIEKDIGERAISAVIKSDSAFNSHDYMPLSPFQENARAQNSLMRIKIDNLPLSLPATKPGKDLNELEKILKIQEQKMRDQLLEENSGEIYKKETKKIFGLMQRSALYNSPLQIPYFF